MIPIILLGVSLVACTATTRPEPEPMEAYITLPPILPTPESTEGLWHFDNGRKEWVPGEDIGHNVYQFDNLTREWVLQPTPTPPPPPPEQPFPGERGYFDDSLWRVLSFMVFLWMPVFMLMAICGLTGRLLPRVEWKSAMLLGVPFGIINFFLTHSTSLLSAFYGWVPEISSLWVLLLSPVPASCIISVVPVSILISWSVWRGSPRGTSVDFWAWWDNVESKLLYWKLKLELKLKRRTY